MTQLELPPISFARYVDLLKRRRWQVIPMSIAGLLVGAVVAFLIPRYYVAQTSVTYQGRAIDINESRTSGDPLQLAMADASLAIPARVPDALARLGILGVDVETDEAQRIVDSYRFRTEIRDSTQRTGNTVGYTTVTIQYKDIDGRQAADFANALRTVWLEYVRSDLESRASADLAKAQADARDLGLAWDETKVELQRFVTDWDVEPLQPGAQQGLGISLRGERNRLEGEINEAKTQIEAAEAVIAENNAYREHLPPTVLKRQTAPLDQSVVREFQRLSLELENAERGKLNTGPQNPNYAHYFKRYQRAKQRIAELQQQLGGPGGGEMIVNPEITALTEENARQSRIIAAQKRVLAGAEKRVAEIDEKLVRLPEAYAGYEALKAELDQRYTELESARRTLGDLERRYERTRRGDHFRVAAAGVPPAPTDPNIVLVALIGCVMGLGAAIGLVLLLDVMRSNFKTVDDVEYALTVPVLGTMSYLETAEEHVQLVRHRRRVAIAAATFLVLSLSVVMVYYVDPTRLPLVVYDALHLVLGSAQ